MKKKERMKEEGKNLRSERLEGGKDEKLEKNDGRAGRRKWKRRRRGGG